MELANTLSLVEKCLEAISGKYGARHAGRKIAAAHSHRKRRACERFVTAARQFF